MRLLSLQRTAKQFNTVAQGRGAVAHGGGS